MEIKVIASYIGSAIAVAFGVALLWLPPATLAGQSGTVGAAFAFVTGGLAALGVTVTVPVVRAAAVREARAAAIEAKAARRTARKPREPRKALGSTPAPDATPAGHVRIP